MQVRCQALHPSVARGVIVVCALVLVTGVPSIARAGGVVGTGTAVSCTDASLNVALAGGGR